MPGVPLGSRPGNRDHPGVPMFKAAGFVVALSVMLACTAAASTFRLRWNDCSASPSSQTVETFSCDDDHSTFRLVGSLTSDFAANIKSLQADVDLEACGRADLPNWWQFQDGGCRAGSITVSPSVAGSSCPNLWPAGTLGVALARYPVLAMPANLTRISALCVAPDSVPLPAGTEVNAFQIVIDSRRTTAGDAPVCGGCNQSLCLAWWATTFNPGPQQLSSYSTGE